MSQVSQLYALQEIDTEIDEKKQRLGEVLRALKGPEALVVARAQQEEAAAELQRWQVQHKDLSLELQGVNQKAKSAENRLYSGNVKNPKELEDLQHSIEGMKRQRAVAEDRVLEVMIMVEEAEEALATAVAEVDRLEAAWVEDQVTLAAEKDELAGALGPLMAKRKEQAARLPAKGMLRYEQLRAKKGGIAVVRVRGEMCLGCRITVSVNRIREARQGKQVYCDGCGRIIYPHG